MTCFTVYKWFSVLHRRKPKFSLEAFACPNSNKLFILVKVKVKWSLYRPGVAQSVGRGIALFFHNRGTRRWWVVSSTPQPHFTFGKDPVPILQEAGWVPGPVWTGGKSRPQRDSIPGRPARSSVATPTKLPCPLFIYVLTFKAYWLSAPTGLTLTNYTLRLFRSYPGKKNSDFCPI